MSNAAVTNWDKGAEIAGVAEPVIDFTVADDGSYIVYTAAGLLAWAAEAQKDLSLGCTLADDIDMSGQAWTPIGDGSHSNSPAYTGTFDGAGHTIRNLSITSQAYSVGLFGGIRGGTVKNLTLENPQISGNNYAGGIVGVLQINSTMENCHVSGGSITGGNGTGAIAGSASGMVRACSSSSVEVSGNGYSGMGGAGGIVGWNGYGTNLYSCYAAEPLLTGASGVSVGAIAGAHEVHASITACYWSGDAAAGVGYNYGTADIDVYKVDGTTVTWQSACDAMNTALPAEFGWRWTTGGGSLPTLVPNE